jgi:ribosomal protein S27AE
VSLNWYKQQGLVRGAPPARNPMQSFTPRPDPRQNFDPGLPPGQVAVGTHLQYWHGSRDAIEADKGNCPKCGSGNYMPTVKSESAAGGKGGAAMGHCMACSYRGDHAVLSGPSMQVRGSLRALDPGIPVKQARVAASVGFRTINGDIARSGGFGIIDKVG